MIRRLGVTLAGLIAYLAASRFPLPFIDANAAYELTETIATVVKPRISLVALGVMPFLTGFILVEIFSLLTPPGPRLRHAGIEGRRTLNRWALGVSTVIALVQAYGLALFFRRVTTLGGARLTSAPAWLLALTTVAATFAVALVAEMISRYGLGNGFAVLLVAPTVLQVTEAVHDLGTSSPDNTPEARIMSMIWAALFVAALVAYWLRRPVTELFSEPEEANDRREARKSIPYRLPPLPQGTVPLAWSYGLLGLLTRPLLGGSTLVPSWERSGPTSAPPQSGSSASACWLAGCSPPGHGSRPTWRDWWACRHRPTTAPGGASSPWERPCSRSARSACAWCPSSCRISTRRSSR